MRWTSSATAGWSLLQPAYLRPQHEVYMPYFDGASVVSCCPTASRQPIIAPPHRRLTLYSCTSAQVGQAVPALIGLSQLRTLDLTLHAAWSGSEPDPLGDVHVQDWEHWVYLRPMAPLANRLTALALAGAIR